MRLVSASISYWRNRELNPRGGSFRNRSRDQNQYQNQRSAGQWTGTNGGIYYSDNVRIGTYSNSVGASAKLHVFDYQTTDPKLLIEDGNTGDASMEFKISTQSYTMGIDNSDSDKFVFAASTALGTTNVLEVSTTGLSAFQTGVLFNADTYHLGDVGIGTASPIVKLTVNNGVARTSTSKTYSTFIHSAALPDPVNTLAQATKLDLIPKTDIVVVKDANYGGGGAATANKSQPSEIYLGLFTGGLPVATCVWAHEPGHSANAGNGTHSGYSTDEVMGDPGTRNLLKEVDVAKFEAYTP